MGNNHSNSRSNKSRLTQTTEIVQFYKLMHELNNENLKLKNENKRLTDVIDVIDAIINEDPAMQKLLLSYRQHKHL